MLGKLSYRGYVSLAAVEGKIYFCYIRKGGINVREFTNVEIHNEPDTTLYEEETNVILKVVREMLMRVDPNATKGTFVLDGQPRGCEAACIVRLNLADGPGHCEVAPQRDMTSDEVARKVIDDYLDTPGGSMYPLRGREADFGNGGRTALDIRSGIWCIHNPPVPTLVLNATKGRFFTSCYYEAAQEADMAAVLYAVAYAIAKMGQEDEVLQQGMQTIREQFEVEFGDQCRLAESCVNDLFRDYTSPTMAAWQAWHESWEGKLNLFFE